MWFGSSPSCEKELPRRSRVFTSRANQHPHVADPAQDAQREHPTVQCDFFFMVAGKEDAVVAPLMVDAKVRIRYVSVANLATLRQLAMHL